MRRPGNFRAAQQNVSVDADFWSSGGMVTSGLIRRHFLGCLEGIAMTDNEILKTMARYNQWANRDLYAAMRAPPKGEVTKHRRSLFKNILNALNHPLVTDRMWWAHMHKEPHLHKALNEVLYGDFEKFQSRSISNVDRSSVRFQKFAVPALRALMTARLARRPTA
jgi:uncharacterized damage-inducible protein DinB